MVKIWSIKGFVLQNSYYSLKKYKAPQNAWFCKNNFKIDLIPNLIKLDTCI